MSAFRPRKARESAVNTAVVSHVTGVKRIDATRAEAILTKFIATSEAIATASDSDELAFAAIGMSNAAGNNPVLGQLKRVQRDLRGLPPLSAELDSFKNETSEAQNTKITFENEDEKNGSEEEVAEGEEKSETDAVQELAEDEQKLNNPDDEESTENLGSTQENVTHAEKRGLEEEEETEETEEQRQERKRQKKLAKKEKKEKKEKNEKKEKKQKD